MDESVTTSRPRGRFRLIVLAPVLAFVALLCWSVASPIGASPDDDFHLASIWCGLGERDGLCEETGDAATRRVPAEIFVASDCFRYEPGTSAACALDLNGHSASDLIETDRGSFLATYPPVYYATMSLFASPDVETSAVVMRIVNILLFTGIGTLLYVLLPRVRRPTLLWAWTITSVPLGLFLVASNNPSAWAIIGGGTVWLALLGYFETTGRRRLALGALFAVTTVMAAGSRGDAAVYSALAIVAVVVLTMRRDRAYWLAAIFPAVMLVVAVVFYLTSGQTGVSVTGLQDGTPAEAKPSAGTVLVSNMLNVQSLWQGVFGSWPLGWFDTPMPYIVSFNALVVAAAVVFAGLRSQSWRKTIVLAGIAAVLWLLPVYILLQSRDFVGVNVQPRYLLPVIVMFAGVALLRVDSSSLSFGIVQRVLIVASLAVAASVALHVNLRRYVTGIGGGGWNLDAAVEWWWVGPFSPMFVWLIGSLSFAAFLVVVVREIGSRPHLEPATSQ